MADIIIKTTNEERAVYNYCVQKYCMDPNGMQLPKDYVSGGFLRLELDLTANIAQPLTFNVQSNNGIQYDTENRLDQQDRFVFSRMGMFLYTRATPTANRSTAKLYTWPNPTVFATSGEAASLEALYNSLVNIVVGTTNVVPSFDTLRFRKVMTAQEGLATTQTTAIPAGSVAAYAADGWDSENGLTPNIPTIDLDGSQNNQIQIKMPEGVTLSPASGTRVNTLVMFGRGFKIQQAGNIRKK